MRQEQLDESIRKFLTWQTDRLVEHRQGMRRFLVTRGGKQGKSLSAEELQVRMDSTTIDIDAITTVLEEREYQEPEK